jgi:outer membrane protein, heavy metal efflux system
MTSRFPCRAPLWRALGLACLLLGSPAVHALEFEEAVALAERQSPGLAAQASAVVAARHQADGAHRLPAPRLAVGVENLPISGIDRWSLSRDFMTMALALTSAWWWRRRQASRSAACGCLPTAPTQAPGVGQ